MEGDGEKSIPQFRRKTPLPPVTFSLNPHSPTPYCFRIDPTTILGKQVLLHPKSLLCTSTASTCGVRFCFLPARRTALTQGITQQSKDTLPWLGRVKYDMQYPPCPHTHLISIPGLIATRVCCCYCGGIARESLHWSPFVLQPVY